MRRNGATACGDERTPHVWCADMVSKLNAANPCSHGAEIEREGEMDEKLQAALNVRFESDAGVGTIRQYLRALLETLWTEQEGFSGKRPFGNSNWEFDLYAPLVREGFIPGGLDENGDVEILDRKAAEAFVLSLIREAFKQPDPPATPPMQAG